MFDIEILSGFFCRIGCRVKKKVELVASSERKSIELSKNKEVPLVACNGDRFIQSLPGRPRYEVRTISNISDETCTTENS